MILALGSGLYAIAPLKKPGHQWAIRSYTVVLFFWAIVFAVVAGGVLPYYANWVRGILDGCGDKDSLKGYLWSVDALYLKANSRVCQVGCPCAANST